MKKLLVIVLMLKGSVAWAAEIKDVKPPVDLPPNYFWLYLLLTLLSLALIFVVARFLLRRFAHQRNAPRVPALPPWEVALQALQKLDAENLPGQGKVKEYYIRLSDTLRHYIEGRFDIRAPELTTEEFLWQLKTARELSVTQKGSLKEFLNCCDMVKFARYSSSEQEMNMSMLLAKRFVEETKPAPIAPDH